MIDHGMTVRLREDADNLDPRRDEPSRFEAGKLGMVVGRSGNDWVIRWNDGTSGLIRADLLDLPTRAPK